MSNLKFDEDGLLSLKDGSKTYQIAEDGKITLQGSKDALEADEIKKVAKAFGKDAEGFLKGKSVKEEELASIRKIVGALEGTHADSLKKVTGILKSAEELETLLNALPADKAADAATLTKIKKILALNPEVAHIMEDVDAHRVLHSDTFKDGEKVKRIIDFDALDKEAGKLRSGITKLEELAEKGTDEKTVRKILLEHPAELKDVLPQHVIDDLAKSSRTSAGVDVVQLATTIEKDAKAYTDKLVPLSQDIIKLQEELDEAKGGARLQLQKDLRGKVKELAALKADPVNEGFGSRADAALKAALSEDELSSLKKGAATQNVFKDLGKTSEAAEEGAKKGGKLFSLMHGEEKLAEIAKAKSVNGAEVAVKDLKFFDKLNKGKTALVAGGVLLIGSVIAGMGNKGPGERAEAEAMRRSVGGAEPARG